MRWAIATSSLSHAISCHLISNQPSSKWAKPLTPKTTTRCSIRRILRDWACSPRNEWRVQHMPACLPSTLFLKRNTGSIDQAVRCGWITSLWEAIWRWCWVLIAVRRWGVSEEECWFGFSNFANCLSVDSVASRKVQCSQPGPALRDPLLHSRATDRQGTRQLQPSHSCSCREKSIVGVASSRGR